MSADQVLILVFSLGIAFLVLGVPLAFTFALIGTLGIFLLEGPNTAISFWKLIPHRVVASYLLSALPMFLIFGYLAERTGIARGTYQAASKWFGGFRGGLGVATTVAAGIFGAASGSTVSASALFGRIAIPELRASGWSKELAVGCVASAGLVAATIPPSIPLLFYGMLTSESVVKLFAAGFIPGIIQIILCIVVVLMLSKFSKGVPRTQKSTSLKEKIASLVGIWPILLVAFAILGSIYAGIATVTESAAVGTFLAILIMAAKKQLNAEIVKDATKRTVMTLAMVFSILIGGTMFSTFLVLSGTAGRLSEAIGSLPVPAWVIIIIIACFYLVLGMFVDGLSMLVITVPVLAPIIADLGYSPIWFGVFTTIMVEAGAVTPPVALNICVLKNTVGDITLEQCFRGVVPFYTGIVALILIMIAFPQVALWIPNMIK